MNKIIILLFLFFFASEVFPQQEAASGAFVHLTKVDIPPGSLACTERSAACTAAEVEKYLLQHIPGAGPLAEAKSGKLELPVRIILGTDGRVSWASVKGIPQETGNELVKRLKEMPAFTPGEHDGEKANVIVDLRMPLHFLQSENSSFTVVSSEDTALQPVWKNCMKNDDPATCTSIAVNDWMSRKVRTAILKEPGTHSLTAAYVVGVDGRVNAVVVHGDNEAFAAEVINQLQKMPPLEYAKDAGTPVAVSFLLPMTLKRI